MSAEDQNAKQPRYCQSCGENLPPGSKFCPNGGSPSRQQAAPASAAPALGKEPSNASGVFVLGLLYVLGLVPLGIVGLLVSRKGRREIKTGKASQSGLFSAGRIMSIIGTIVTGIGLLTLVAVIAVTVLSPTRTPDEEYAKDEVADQPAQRAPSRTALPTPDIRNQRQDVERQPEKPKKYCPLVLTANDDIPRVNLALLEQVLHGSNWGNWVILVNAESWRRGTTRSWRVPEEAYEVYVVYGEAVGIFLQVDPISMDAYPHTGPSYPSESEPRNENLSTGSLSVTINRVHVPIKYHEMDPGTGEPDWTARFKPSEYARYSAD